MIEAETTTANFIMVMAAAATGVSVITTEGSAGRFGLTVSAISSMSAEPPMLLACSIAKAQPLLRLLRMDALQSTCWASTIRTSRKYSLAASKMASPMILNAMGGKMGKSECRF